MSGVDISGMAAIVSSISALVVAIFSVYKVFFLEKKLRDRTITQYKDTNTEKTINGLGDLVTEIQRLRHKIHKIINGFRENSVEECKIEIQKSRDDIHSKYSDILRYGVVESVSLVHSGEVHRVKKNAVEIAEKLYSELEKERVVSIADISEECIDTAKRFHKELREQRSELSNVQLQLITMFGRSI